MGVSRLIALLFGLVVLIQVIGAYLTADEELVLIDEGPGRWSGSDRNNLEILIHKFHFDHLFYFIFLLFTVCYSIIFNGRRLSHRYIERSVAVISLDECKLLCTRETSFDCRSFNYRYKLFVISCAIKFLLLNIFVTQKTKIIVDQLRSESRRLGQFGRHQQPRFLFRFRRGFLPARRSRSELLPPLWPPASIAHFLLIRERVLLRIHK
jgi:hypothetical protein